MVRKEPLTGPCRKCQVRKIRRATGLCDPCDNLTKAEGTHKDVALPTAIDRYTEHRVKVVKLFNKLIVEGVPFRDIAAKLGMTRKALSMFLYRAKAYGGLEVVNTTQVRIARMPQPIVDTSNRPRMRNEHGGGKWGVNGCKCQPCQKVVAASRRRLDDARKASDRSHKKKPS